MRSSVRTVFCLSFLMIKLQRERVSRLRYFRSRVREKTRSGNVQKENPEVRWTLRVHGLLVQPIHEPCSISSDTRAVFHLASVTFLAYSFPINKKLTSFRAKVIFIFGFCKINLFLSCFVPLNLRRSFFINTI